MGRSRRTEGPIAPYRSGPNLVALFNQFGFTDEYAQGFPSRWAFAEQKIRALDGTPKLAQAVDAALHAREFLDTIFDPKAAVGYVNRYLVHDGLEVVSVGGHFRLRHTGRPGVDLDPDLLSSDDPLTEAFAREQVEKCGRKITEGDYDGAITNARALVEAVLLEVERRLDAKRPQYDGDLPNCTSRCSDSLVPNERMFWSRCARFCAGSPASSRDSPQRETR